MRFTRILVAFYAAFAAYMVVDIVDGSAGLSAHAELTEYKQRLAGNIAELDAIGRNLAVEIDDLQSNPDRVRIEARRLQLYAPGERIVRIEGYNGRARPLTPGGLVLSRPARATPRALHRAIAAAAGLLTFVLSRGLPQRRRDQVAPRD